MKAISVIAIVLLRASAVAAVHQKHKHNHGVDYVADVASKVPTKSPHHHVVAHNHIVDAVKESIMAPLSTKAPHIHVPHNLNVDLSAGAANAVPTKQPSHGKAHSSKPVTDNNGLDIAGAPTKNPSPSKTARPSTSKGAFNNGGIDLLDAPTKRPSTSKTAMPWTSKVANSNNNVDLLGAPTKGPSASKSANNDQDGVLVNAPTKRPSTSKTARPWTSKTAGYPSAPIVKDEIISTGDGTSDAPSSVPSGAPIMATETPTSTAESVIHRSNVPSIVLSDFPSHVPSGYPTIVSTTIRATEKPASVSTGDENTEKPVATVVMSDVPSQSPSDVRDSAPIQATEKPASVSTDDESTEKPVFAVNLSDAPSLTPSDVPSSSPSKTTEKPASASTGDGSTEKPVAAVVMSDVPSQSPSDVPSSSPSKTTEKPASVSTGDGSTEKPVFAVKLSDAPSLTPSDVRDSAPIHATEKPASVSTHDESTEKPVFAVKLSDAPSLTPSDVPSSSPSKTTEKPASVSTGDGSTEKPVAAVVMSDVPSQSPSDVRNSAPIHATEKPASVSTGDGSTEKPVLAVKLSDAPSLTPSDVPSSSPNKTTEKPASVSTGDGSTEKPVGISLPSDIPSVVLSDFPSSMPSITPSSQTGLFFSDVPSLVSDGFSMQPSSIFLQDGVVYLKSDFKEIMDKDTVQIFEQVVAEQFLPQVLPLVHLAKYTDIQCFVESQTLLHDGTSRKLFQRAKMVVKTEEVSIVLKITSNVDPPADNFDELVTLAMQQYSLLLQQLLSEETDYFEPAPTIAPTNSPVTAAPTVPIGDVSAVEEQPESSDTEALPIMVIVGAAVGGVLVALLGIFFYNQGRQTSSNQQPPGGCSINLSENGEEPVFPFGMISDTERGSVMISRSISDLSGSNFLCSPGPYPCLTFTEDQTVEEYPLHPTLSPSRRRPDHRPVSVLENDMSPGVSPRSESSRNRSNITASATSVEKDLEKHRILCTTADQYSGTYVERPLLSEASSLDRYDRVSEDGLQGLRLIASNTVEEAPHAYQTQDSKMTYSLSHDEDEDEIVQSKARTKKVKYYTEKDQTVSSSRPSRTKHVLNDLDEMEKEWTDQLDSKTTTTSLTPKQGNRERFKKPSRDLLY